MHTLVVEDNGAMFSIVQDTTVSCTIKYGTKHLWCICILAVKTSNGVQSSIKLLYASLSTTFTAGCTGRFLEIFSPQSELMETNPYSFYLGTVSGSSDSTILMHTCNDQTEVAQSRRPGVRFFRWLRATLRR